MTYPVLVPVSSKTDAERRERSSARLGGNLDNTAALEREAAAASRLPRKLPMKPVKIAKLGINVFDAVNLRGADRSGLSDPYAMVRVPGKPRTKHKTRVLK